MPPAPPQPQRVTASTPQLSDMPVSRALLPEKPVSTPPVAVCEKSGECTAVRMGLQAIRYTNHGTVGRSVAWVC